MYDDYYQSRLNIQQICSFFRNGISNEHFQGGTPKERYEKNEKDFYKSLEDIREKILFANGDFLEDEKMKKVETEELFVDTIMKNEINQELSYEMGFRAGFSFAQDMYEH
jgi:uncharacterized protein YfkK (UPF0435 family)